MPIKWISLQWAILKHFMLVNYGSRVVITSKLLITFGEAL